MSCSHLYDVAPYALGTLDPDERAQVAAHLSGCADCQDVLESVAGLPGLLARVGPDTVDPDAVEAGTGAADEAMFERLVARSRPDATPADRPVGPTGEHGRRAAGGGRWRRWAAAGVAAAVVGVGTGAWVVETRSQDAVRVVSASAGAVHARVWLRPASAGTAVRIELGGVAAEQHCSLVAVDRDGNREVAATWEAGYDGTGTFDGSVPVPVDRLASLRVETDRATLLTMPLR